MKTELKIALGAFAAYCVYVFYKADKDKKQKEGNDSIGAIKPKRRIWNEVELAQRAGIDLTDPSAWEHKRGELRNIIHNLNIPIKPSSASDKPTEQRYFNQLARAYKSIAGTNLPYDQSIVRNEYGDVILIYNDYHIDQLPNKAADYVQSVAEQNYSDPYGYGYWATIAAIAKGQKFIWKGTKNGVHRGIEELVFGKSSPAERKLRISYLASPEKGGVYVEKFAHGLWERNGGEQDDQDITNGVLDAIRECSSVGAARQACIDEYLNAHQVQEQALFQDVPF